MLLLPAETSLRSMAQAANILNYQTPCGTASDSTLHVNCVDRYETSAAWNYGANFGGPTKSTWTSGANSLTAGNSAATTGQGMFGRYAVSDNNYDDDDGGTANNASMKIHMCDGVRMNKYNFSIADYCK